MHAGIEQDTQLVSKVLRKVQWIQERDRTVSQLNQVHPPSFPPVSDREDPAAAGVGTCGARNLPSPSSQMVASLQGALKADSPRGETVATTGSAASVAWDELSDVDEDMSEGSDSDVEIEDQFPGHVSASRHPRAFSQIFREQPPPTDSCVHPTP